MLSRFRGWCENSHLKDTDIGSFLGKPLYFLIKDRKLAEKLKKSNRHPETLEEQKQSVIKKQDVIRSTYVCRNVFPFHVFARQIGTCNFKRDTRENQEFDYHLHKHS